MYLHKVYLSFDSSSWVVHLVSKWKLSVVSVEPNCQKRPRSLPLRDQCSIFRIQWDQGTDWCPRVHEVTFFVCIWEKSILRGTWNQPSQKSKSSSFARVKDGKKLCKTLVIHHQKNMLWQEFGLVVRRPMCYVTVPGSSFLLLQVSCSLLVYLRMNP